MSERSKLQDALAALNDAMSSAPLIKPHGTKGRWNSASIRLSAIGHDTKWETLPAKPKGGSSAATKVETAQTAVENADYEDADSVRSALHKVENALAEVEAILT